MADLNSLSGEQIKELATFAKFKSEADRLYETIMEYQKMPLYCDECTIWKDEHNREYLKHSGDKWVWIAAYLHQHYEVPIDREAIFQTLKNNYLFEAEHKNTCYANKDKEAMEYFTSYVKKLEEKPC
jgi:hypothetical protein